MKINIFLAIITGLAIISSLYIYKKKFSSEEISEFKKKETSRLLDSIYKNIDEEQDKINKNQENNNEQKNDYLNSIENNVTTISNQIKDKTIYSVQIFAFSKNKYPLLSETIAGTTSKSEFFKYSIGIFNTLKEAQKLRANLVKIGFKDAFVASYLNGKRIKIENPY